MKKLFNLWLNTTDKFLCDRIKNTFAKTENEYKRQHKEFNLEKELKHFEENPLGCVIGLKSDFETKIKLKIKLMVGLFFVLIPIAVFSLFSYFTHTDYSFAFLAALPVAVWVSSRMENLSKRYVHNRAAGISC